MLEFVILVITGRFEINALSNSPNSIIYPLDHIRFYAEHCYE